MGKISKRAKANREKLTPGKTYPIDEAINLLKEMQAPKFVETVELVANLGIDPRKSDQNVRGALVLPHGTGRKMRVAVCTTESHAEAAKKAGADIVGLEDLAEKIKAGNMDFDVLIATPDAMRVVGQLGQVLGPKGLMPNPKDGTVTKDIAAAIKNAKSGQVRYRTDKAGVVHCVVGKMDFSKDAIRQNLDTILAALRKAKPATSKGVYFKRVTISSTMGPGIAIDVTS